MAYLATPLLLLLLSHLLTSGHAINIYILNSCPYTVWAAASPGGGRRLDRGQRWTLTVPAGTAMARVWGRTDCNFDGSGRGRCQTGDCGGVLDCTGWGVPPNTLAEYALNQFGNMDFYDISLVDGFNIPMVFGPTSPRGGTCRQLSCTADINGQCPNPLRVPGGCNNPCTTFQTNEYCCTQGPAGRRDTRGFLKRDVRMPIVTPQDDPSSTFTCPSGTTNYRVVFCPTGSSSDKFPIEMYGSSVSE